MKKKCFVLFVIFSMLGLLFFSFDTHAQELDDNNNSNVETNEELHINEDVTVSIEGIDEVYINDSLIGADTTLTESGIYNVKYVLKKTKTEDVEVSEGVFEQQEVDYYEETLKQYVIIKLDLASDEVYFEEKEVNLVEIEGVNYYLNNEEVKESFICDNEGKNCLRITYKNLEKNINFDIFKFANKEEFEGKNYTELVNIEYTLNTNATVYLNNEVFDGNINTFGNYSFKVMNSNNEEIGSLSFVIDAVVTINNKEYQALNSSIELESPIKLSTYAKIEYSYDAVEAKLSGFNIYSGYITYNPGTNSLMLKGVGNYILNLTFNITPVTNIINDHTYSKEVLPIVSGGNVFVNGNAFSLGKTINTAGEYEMVINGLEDNAVATYYFNVAAEEFNVTSSNFKQALIAAKTNNYMLLNNNTYNSGDVIYNVGDYEFEIYYPTYKTNNNTSNPYTDDTFIKSNYYYSEKYSFSIELGINIVDGKEYFDNTLILFSGFDSIELTFGTNTFSIESGYLADKVGNYTLSFDGNTISFSVTPSLNVENNQIYLNNALVLKNYDFIKNDNVHFELTCETGKTESNKTVYTDSNVLNRTLSSGTYSLKITTDESYEKIVNFIVVSSSVINRGAAYQNGKAFDINMYGVNVYLNSPLTLTRVRTTNLYNGEAINTVGKHYMSFDYTLNGVSSTFDIDTAVFFYVLPVITINETETTSKNLKSDLEASLTFKDGNGVDIENDNYDCISLDNNSNQNQIVNNDSIYFFDEVGIHYIKLNLDGYSYQITLTIDSYFYKDEIDTNNIYSSTSSETYLTTNNKFKEEVTFVNKNNILSYKLDNVTNINGVKITEVGNHKLYLKGTNNYSKVLVFVIEENVLVNNEIVEIKSAYSDLVYEDSVSFNIIGDATYLLDGSTYENGSLVDTVGNHYLTIKGANNYSKIYKFQIKENLVVSLNNEFNNTFSNTYTENFTFSINYDKISSVKLNDNDVLTKNNTIDKIGNYKLTIEGTNSYTKVYTFKVLPTLSFVSGDTTTFKSDYTNTVTPTLDNSKGLSYTSVKLNNALYDFDTLDTIGKYTLVLLGEGNYKETYTFNINESLLYSFDNIEYKALTKTIEIADDAKGKPIYIKKEINDVTYKNVLLNSNSIEEASLNDFILIDTLGNNKLVINNVTYSISLREINDNLYETKANASNNKYDYLNEISFNDSLKYEIYLDGELYNNQKITSFGLHKVEVKGISYTNTYYFYINLNTNILNNESYYSNVEIESNADEVKIYANEKLITDSILNKVGSYKVKYLGLYESKEEYVINLKAKMNLNNDSLADINTKDLINISYVDGSNTYKTVLLNGNNYDFNTINTIGNNVLKLIDINDTEVKYNLVINAQNYIKSDLYLTKALANQNELASFVMNVNDSYQANISLDGILKSNDFTNDIYGLHEVNILGINDYQESYYFAIKLNTNVLNTTYENELDITCNASFLVDGKEVSKVLEIGNHTISIKKQNIKEFDEISIDFTIVETVSGFNDVNTTKVTPVINGNIKNVTLTNNANYQLGDVISKAGYYILTVYGSNDYVNSYEFALIPEISFENYDSASNNTNEVYIKSTDVTFDLYVNGKETSILNSIDTIGNNLIEIKGYDYSYSKTITLNETTNIETSFNEEDNFIPQITNLKAKEVYLDGNLYDGMPVVNYGKHVLTIKGVNDYEVSYSFIINLNTNILNNETYYSSQIIKANSKIYVNGIEANSLNLVGHNIIKFVGLDLEEEYNVTLKENVSGYDENEYKEFNLLRFENVSGIILDDNKIDSTDNVIELNVKEVGNHRFKLLGLNGYESKEYSFTIIESLPLLENNNVFTNEIIINVENVKGLLLNGKEFENNSKVSLIGSYKLTVLGLAGYSNNYEFIIVYNMTGIEDGGVYVGKVKATCANANMSLDGNPYNSGDAIYEVGYHKLIITGDESENTYTYDFTILPDLSSNEIINEYDLNNVVINDAKAFKVSELSKLKLTLNGNEYNGEVIYDAGNYELTLNGSNNYKKTYSFRVEPIIGSFELVYNEAFTPVIADNLNYELLLNDESYNNGTTINKVGNYKLAIKGVNYLKEFSFVIKENISYKSNNEFVKLGSTLIYNDQLIINNENNLTYKMLLNGEEVSSLTVINTLGNNVLTVVGENGYETTYNILLKEALNINDLDTYNDADLVKPEIINNLNGLVLIDGENNQTINGFGKHMVTVKGLDYENSYIVNINLDSNIEADKIYVESKEININSNFLVDGKLYTNSFLLDEVGNHNIVILGYGDKTLSLNITIKEKLQGFVDGKDYNNKIIPSINNAKLVLDGKDFESNTVVELVGNHVLDVYGSNGYKNTYTFTINNKEFEDNQIIENSLTINIPNAKLSIDGNAIENNEIITEVGNHTLIVEGVNGYSKEYQFTINNKEFENNQSIKGSLLIDVPNAKLFVDGNEIENLSTINEVGNHTLTVCGSNGYRNEYQFTINPDTQIIQTGTDRGIVANITSTNVCQTITIDDEYYEAGMSYSNVGNHTLTITGTNGYSYQEDFTIDAEVGVNNEGVYNNKIVINTLDADEIILDGIEMTKDVVISNGTHTLIIRGANGYEKTVTFTYYNPNNMFVYICTLALILVFIATPVATLFVKKRKETK